MTSQPDKYAEVWMRTARDLAQCSRAPDKKVGCVAVQNNRIITCGYNGTLPGTPNTYHSPDGRTLDTVLHAEMNVICYAAQQGIPLRGCDIYTTLSPCPVCAVQLAACGIRKLVYLDTYKDASGLGILASAGVEVVQVVLPDNLPERI